MEIFDIEKPKQSMRLPQLNKQQQRLRRNLPESRFLVHCREQQDRLDKAHLTVWDSLKLTK